MKKKFNSLTFGLLMGLVSGIMHFLLGYYMLDFEIGLIGFIFGGLFVGVISGCALEILSNDGKTGEKQ